jgi:hypothetical protein
MFLCVLNCHVESPTQDGQLTLAEGSNHKKTAQEEQPTGPNPTLLRGLIA